MDQGHESVGGNGHWFEPVAEFLGPAYLRYSFTKGTEQEVRALIDLLGLTPGQRLLDVGCGPGRHALALARAGIEVLGLDIAAPFIALATSQAEAEGLAGLAAFRVADARRLEAETDLEGRFDAVISLCQGAFGLAGGPQPPSPAPAGGPDPAESTLAERELDQPILAGMARALRPGGRLALSAFSAYFQLRYLEDSDTFDAERGVNHEHTTLRDTEGNERPAQLWTSCFTPRELRLLARAVGLRPQAVYGVAPGAYRPDPPGLTCPEFLLIAQRPGPGT